MSIAKRLHEEHTTPASWRRVVVSPSREMWDGSTGKAACPSCPWSTEYRKEEKIPLDCPRCGARLVA